MVSVDRREWDQLREVLDYLRQRDAVLDAVAARWSACAASVDVACKLTTAHVVIDAARADVAALMASMPVAPAALSRPPLALRS
jgi:hypothetical protein